MSADPKTKVVIVGSGLVGRNWALLFAKTNKYNVTLYDIKESQLTEAIDNIKNVKLPLLLKFGMVGGGGNKNSNNDEKEDNKDNNNSSSIIDKVMSNITTTKDLTEALTNASFIQTCVPENLELKQKVFSQIELILTKIKNTNCIISSSASTLKPSNLILKMSNKNIISNCLVCHPVNPPIAIPVVEIVPHNNTSNKTREYAKNIMSSIGMKPILMKKECDGFIVNRLQYGLLQAAYQLYSEGIASAKDIDIAISDGLGARWSFMGPFETIHLNAPKGVKDYCERYAHTCIAPIVSKQDNNVKWEPKIWNEIHNEMIETIPVKNVSKRCEWRDNRLMELAQLKNKQNQRDSGTSDAKKQQQQEKK